MQTCVIEDITSADTWAQFLSCVKEKCSETAFRNWFGPIRLISQTEEEVAVSIPNIFVKEYIFSNFQEELRAFLPLNAHDEPQIRFVIEESVKKPAVAAPLKSQTESRVKHKDQELFDTFQNKLNENYRFSTYIEGPTNQFVKSAAVGVAMRPGKAYSPLFIHGGVGLGKTHLLHSIGHAVKEQHRNLRVQCITTEGFINQLVDSLRNKSLDRMKRFYRNNVDVLLVDDIQFLQNRGNFEEEFVNTFEALKNQNKQIVITSDKPPSQLQLSQRIVARMEWGLVANVGMPDIETRIAILQHKAELRGFKLSHEIAFLIAEGLSHNIRQLEGAINRLSAYVHFANKELNEALVEEILGDMFQQSIAPKIMIDDVLQGVSSVLEVRLSDLKGPKRSKDIALARQVAMYLAKELIETSLVSLAEEFGKTHSTLLHAAKTIEKKLEQDELLKRKVEMIKRHLRKAR